MTVRPISARLIVILVCATLYSAPGCIGVARVSDLPRSADEIDFEALRFKDDTAPR